MVWCLFGSKSYLVSDSCLIVNLFFFWFFLSLVCEKRNARDASSCRKGKKTLLPAAGSAGVYRRGTIEKR